MRVFFSILLVLFFLFVYWSYKEVQKSDNPDFFKIDSCLDSGGCWDYTRRRCETEDQGYCVRTPEICQKDFHGVWDYEKSYCKMK